MKVIQKNNPKYSSWTDDPNKLREAYTKQIIDLNNHKGKKIHFYKALEIVYKKRSISLASYKPNNINRPVVILDRNFKSIIIKN